MCDIDRCFKNFNKSAGFLLRKFYHADLNVELFLFNSFCTSFYGCELWNCRKKCPKVLRDFSVSYHAVLKRILHVPRFFSNHYVCSRLCTLTFNHFLNFKLARFIHFLKNTDRVCFFTHRFYFLENSFYKK